MRGILKKGLGLLGISLVFVSLSPASDIAVDSQNPQDDCVPLCLTAMPCVDSRRDLKPPSAVRAGAATSKSSFSDCRVDRTRPTIVLSLFGPHFSRLCLLRC